MRNLGPILLCGSGVFIRKLVLLEIFSVVLAMELG